MIERAETPLLAYASDVHSSILKREAGILPTMAEFAIIMLPTMARVTF